MVAANAISYVIVLPVRLLNTLCAMARHGNSIIRATCATSLRAHRADYVFIIKFYYLRQNKHKLHTKITGITSFCQISTYYTLIQYNTLYWVIPGKSFPLPVQARIRTCSHGPVTTAAAASAFSRRYSLQFCYRRQPLRIDPDDLS